MANELTVYDIFQGQHVRKVDMGDGKSALQIAIDIGKGEEIFSALAECATVMYGELHPEVKWSDALQDTISKALNE